MELTSVLKILEPVLKLWELTKSFVLKPLKIKIIHTRQVSSENNIFLEIKLWLSNKKEGAIVITKYRFQALEPKELTLDYPYFHTSDGLVYLEKNSFPLSNYTKDELLNTLIPLRIGGREDIIKTLFIRVKQQLEESTLVKVRIILTDIDDKNYKVKTIC